MLPVFKVGDIIVFTGYAHRENGPLQNAGGYYIGEKYKVFQVYDDSYTSKTHGQRFSTVAVKDGSPNGWNAVYFKLDKPREHHWPKWM